MKRFIFLLLLFFFNSVSINGAPLDEIEILVVHDQDGIDSSIKILSNFDWLKCLDSDGFDITMSREKLQDLYSTMRPRLEKLVPVILTVSNETDKVVTCGKKILKGIPRKKRVVSNTKYFIKNQCGLFKVLLMIISSCATPITFSLIPIGICTGDIPLALVGAACTISEVACFVTGLSLTVAAFLNIDSFGSEQRRILSLLSLKIGSDLDKVVSFYDGSFEIQPGTTEYKMFFVKGKYVEEI